MKTLLISKGNSMDNRLQMINHPGFIPSFTSFVLDSLKDLGVEDTQTLINVYLPAVGKEIIGSEHTPVINLFYTSIVPFIYERKDKPLMEIIKEAVTKVVQHIKDNPALAAAFTKLPTDISDRFLNDWVVH